MTSYIVKTRKTLAPEEQVIDGENPEQAVESIIVASEEAGDGSSVEVLQVTPAPPAAPPAEAPVEQPAEAPATTY